MKKHPVIAILLASTFVASGAVQPALADTASTAAIVAGAAAIVGALLIDANNRPYYVNNGRRYYVTQDEANSWKQHHRVVQRRAYVPEQEYPVARNPYNNQHR
jgi:3-hydroxy-3-methylglutaryl CoA synthase